jgi:hypothetical protein
LKRIFGFEKMANFKAIIRLFRKFSQVDNERIANSLYGWQFRQLGIDGLTLDLDSTVMTRHGIQQGAAKGYNSRKPGRLPFRGGQALGEEEEPAKVQGQDT